MSTRDHSGHARDDMVVARVQALAPHLDGEPDPAFRAATRARLVAMAAVRTPEPAPVSPLRRLLRARTADVSPPRPRTRLTSGLAGAALSVTALAAVVALATDAGPGDVLYDLKRGTEQTQLALAGDSRGQTLLDFASTRLEELKELVGTDTTALPALGWSAGPATGTVLAAGADPGLVISTLDTMDDQTTEGASWLTTRAVETGSDEPLTHLSDWAAGQAAGLAALRGNVPSAAVDEVEGSLVLLSDLTDRAAALRTALACSSGPATDGSDGLGPVPGECVTGRPAPQGTAGTTTSVPPVGGSSTVPPSSSPAGPSVSAPGGGTGGLPIPSVPGVPGVPSLPSLPTRSVPINPSLPLPSVSLPGSDAKDTPPPAISVPGPPGISICLPPLATIGNC